MALIDKASLLMVPSTYEAGKLYNVLPSGNRAPDSTDQNSGYDQTRADFDFDRGSNAAATRIGSDGLLKKYRENLLLQSNQFDTTWTSQLIGSITGSKNGYNDLPDAWLLTPTASSGQHHIRNNISSAPSGIYTFSAYVKAGGKGFAFLQCVDSGGGNFYGYFNLSDGSSSSNNYGGSGTIIQTTTEDVGGGWYRLLMTLNGSGSNSARIGIANGAYTGAHSFSTSITDTIYIQNAQLETGTIATDYLDSTSVTGKAGVLVDLPRINYDANGENGALLLEPSRANIIESSEYLGHSSWAYTRITQSANEAVSPEGVQNATLIANTTDTGNHTAANSLGSYTNASLAVSFYAKKKDNDYLQFGIYNSSTKWAAQKINLATGAKLGNGNTGFHDAPSGVSVTDVGNDWWRVEALFTTTLTGATETFYFAPTPTDANPTGTFGLYGGWTGATTENAYIYGVQVESGVSYSTSYIPNHGESGGVTRAADSCSVTGASDVIGQTEGTIYIDVQTPDAIQNNTTFSIGGGTSSEYAQIEIRTDLSINWRYRVGGTDYINANVGSYSAGDRLKIAFGYKNADSILYLNGSSIATDTGSITSNSWDEVKYSNFADTGKLEASVYETILFNERLSNAELATLTTL